jgi:hypothetical protein
MSLMRPPQSGDPHDVSGVENAADLTGAMSTRPTHKLAGTREPLWIALTDLFQIPDQSAASVLAVIIGRL